MQAKLGLPIMKTQIKLKQWLSLVYRTGRSGLGWVEFHSLWFYQHSLSLSVSFNPKLIFLIVIRLLPGRRNTLFVSTDPLPFCDFLSLKNHFSPAQEKFSSIKWHCFAYAEPTIGKSNDPPITTMKP